MISKIKEAIKKAMIEKNEVRKNTLKMVLNNAQMEAKEAKQEVNEVHILNAINKELKQSNQALQMLKDKNQESGNFYEETLQRVEVLKEYLPKQLTEKEIEDEIRKLIDGIDKSNKGLVMKTVMGELKGKADGKIINQITMNILKE